MLSHSRNNTNKRVASDVKIYGFVSHEQHYVTLAAVLSKHASSQFRFVLCLFCTVTIRLARRGNSSCTLFHSMNLRWKSIKITLWNRMVWAGCRRLLNGYIRSCNTTQSPRKIVAKCLFSLLRISHFLRLNLQKMRLNCSAREIKFSPPLPRANGKTLYH